MQIKSLVLCLFLNVCTPACSTAPSEMHVIFDTSFHAHYFGNVYRDEGHLPEGYVDYSQYFIYAKAYFFLDGTCKFLMSEKNSDGTPFISEEKGTYSATQPAPGGGFSVVYENGREAEYTWVPNWHDPVSTPFELFERRAIVLRSTGQLVNMVFSYVSDFTSEM